MGTASPGFGFYSPIAPLYGNITPPAYLTLEVWRCRIKKSAARLIDKDKNLVLIDKRTGCDAGSRLPHRYI